MIKKINIGLSVIHLLFAAIIGSILFANDFGFGITLRSHKVLDNGSWNSEELFEMKYFVKSGLIFFYAWTSFFHALYALDIKNIYTNSIKSGISPLRWIEYAVSATVMLGIMALLSGVKDAYAFILLLFTSAGIMSTGYWYEVTLSKIPILVGFMLLLGVSLVIIMSFNQRLNEAKSLGLTIPSFVYGVVYIMLSFYNVFGFVPLLPKKYQEYTYMGLSLASKGMLGFLLAVGALR